MIKKNTINIVLDFSIDPPYINLEKINTLLLFQ